MASVVIPYGGQMVLHWSIRGQAVVNVLGLNIDPAGSVDINTANALGTIVRNAMQSSGLDTRMSTGSSLIGVGVRDLRQANLAEFAASLTARAGTDVGEPLPTSTACVVTLRTALAGRSFRGRVFLAMDGAAAWDGAAQAYVSAATGSAAQFITDIKTAMSTDPTLAGRFRLAVLSRTRSLSTPSTTHVVRSAIQGTQRGRIPHRG